QLDLVPAADDAHGALDEERGELLAVNLRENREEIGELPVGDPHLLPVQRVMTAVGAQRGGRPRGERVRSRLRLGERVGANQLAARQPRKVALLLLLSPEIHERQRPYRRMRAERSAER